MLNEEEANLQREILDIHRKEIGKVKQVEQKHNINTAYANTHQLSQKTGDNLPPPSNPNNNVINEDALEESLERLDMMLAKQRNSGKVINQPSINQNPIQKNIPNHPVNNYQKETSLYQQVMQAPPSNQPQQIIHPPVNQTSNIPNYSSQMSGNNYYGNPNALPPKNFPVNPNPYVNNQAPVNPGQQSYSNQQVMYGNINMTESVYSPEFGTKGNQGIINPYQMPPEYLHPQNVNYPPVHNQYPQQQYMQNQYPPQSGYNNPYAGAPYNMNNNNYNYPINNENINTNNQYPAQQMKPPSVNENPKENTEKLKTFSFGNKNIQPNLNEVPELGESLEEYERFEKEVFADHKSVISTKSNVSSSQQNKLERTEEKAGGYGDKKQQLQKGKGAQKPPLNNTNKEPKMSENVGETEDGKVKVVANDNLKHLLLGE